MDSVVAAHLLEQVDAIGDQTRALVRSLWYPFVLWGVFAGVGAICGATLPDDQGWYWLAACGAGMYATARYYRRRAKKIGAICNSRRPLAAGAVMGAMVFAAAIAIPDVATPWVAAGICYQLMARVVHSWTVAAAGWLLIGAAVAGQVAIGGADAVVPVELACSAVLVATGVILRSQQQAAARGLGVGMSLAG